MSTRALLRFPRPEPFEATLAHRIRDALNLSEPRHAEGNDEAVWVTDYQHEDEIEVAIRVPGESSPREPAELDPAEVEIVAEVVAGRTPPPVAGARRKFATRV